MDRTVRYLAALFATVCVTVFALTTAYDQPANNPVIGAPTTNASAKITTGLTYQLLLAAVSPPSPGLPSPRHSLTIENNQASGTDVCYLIIGTLAGQVVAGTTTTSTNVVVNGVTMTAAQASATLVVGEAYTRYFPYVPNDAIYGTCTTTADSIYVDTQ